MSLQLLFGLVLLCLSACTVDTESRIQGKAAPDFTLEAVSGQKTTLSDLRGNVVLVNFWASWCSPCREEIPSLVRLQKAMSGRSFRMLPIAVDNGGREPVRRYLNRSGISLSTLLDPQNIVGRQYGITGIPETFIVDKEGTIAKKIVGPLEWDAPEMVRYLSDLASR
jgi:thiol-disulfide isomerase/thioredoxin